MTRLLRYDLIKRHISGTVRHENSLVRFDKEWTKKSDFLDVSSGCWIEHISRSLQSWWRTALRISLTIYLWSQKRPLGLSCCESLEDLTSRWPIYGVESICRYAIHVPWRDQLVTAREVELENLCWRMRVIELPEKWALVFFTVYAAILDILSNQPCWFSENDCFYWYARVEDYQKMRLGQHWGTIRTIYSIFEESRIFSNVVWKRNWRHIIGFDGVHQM